MQSKLINMEDDTDIILEERGRNSFIKNILIFGKQYEVLEDDTGSTPEEEKEPLEFSIVKLFAVKDNGKDEELVQIAYAEVKPNDTYYCLNNICLNGNHTLLAEVQGTVSINITYIDM